MCDPPSALSGDHQSQKKPTVRPPSALSGDHQSQKKPTVAEATKYWAERDAALAKTAQVKNTVGKSLGCVGATIGTAVGGLVGTVASVAAMMDPNRPDGPRRTEFKTIMVGAPILGTTAGGALGFGTGKVVAEAVVGVPTRLVDGAKRLATVGAVDRMDGDSSAYTDSYHVGDIVRGTIAKGREARNGKKGDGYRFGDFTRGLFSSSTSADVALKLATPSDLTIEAHHRNAIENPMVVVVHHSKNCEFCKKFRPVAEQVERDSYGRHRIVFSDVSASQANQAYFEKLGESGVPAYSKAGKILGVGFKTVPEFRALLERS